MRLCLFFGLLAAVLLASPYAVAMPDINGTFVPTSADGATAQTSQTGVCLGCSVTDLGNVVSPALLQPARLSIPVGVLGAARVRIDLPAVTAGGAAAGFVVRDRTGLLDLGAFERLTVRTRLGDTVRDERAGASLLNVAAVGADRFAFMLRSTQSFDAIELEVAGAALALTDLDVLYGAVRVPQPPTVLVHRAADGASVTTRTSPTCVGCSVEDAGAAIDGSYRTAAELSVPLALAGDAEIEVAFGRTVPAGTRTGFILNRRDGVLDATVLEGLTLRTLFDGELLDALSGPDLATIGYADGRAYVWMRTTETTDAVALRVGTLAALSVDIDVRAAVSVLPRGATREPSGLDALAEAVDLSEATATAFASAPGGSSGSDNGSGVSLGAPAPNPTTGSARIRLAGVPGQSAQVAVYDAVGREVARLHSGPLGAAEAMLAVDTAGWAPGVYVIRALGPEGSAVRRLTVAR